MDSNKQQIEHLVAEGIFGFLNDLLRNITIPNRYAESPSQSEAYRVGYIDGILDAGEKSWKYGLTSPIGSGQQVMETSEHKDFSIEYLAGRHAVRVGNQEVKLTRSEDVLMKLLWDNKDKVCTYNEFNEACKSIGITRYEKVIRAFRRKIDPDPHQPQHIDNIRKMGYILITNPQ